MTDVRLNVALSLVRQGSRVADIGTDHAHLPVCLIQTGRSPFVIASDVKEGPVLAARRSVEAAGLEDKIDVRLADGLSAVKAGEADDIVIAGMGGETIREILQNAPWIQNERYRFILQPMTRAELLRRYLWETGFDILREIPVCDGRHSYTVMSVCYDGVCRTVSDADCFVGKVPPLEGAVYWDAVIARLKKQEAATGDHALAECLSELMKKRRE